MTTHVRATSFAHFDLHPTGTKHGVKKLAQRLEALGYPAAALQGNLSQNARERVMAGFRSGRVPILLATNVAARGLDVPEVGQVINYELPESAEWFTHRAGRTGRMGRAGRAITLLTAEDDAKWRQFEKVLGRRLERRRRHMMWPLEVTPMGERARGKDKGKAKKSPKAAKPGRRPHELHQQMRDALKRPTDAAGGPPLD